MLKMLCYTLLIWGGIATASVFGFNASLQFAMLAALSFLLCRARELGRTKV
jgi:hypothetical protein